MNINPDTSLALMQAAQSNTANAINAAKSTKQDKNLAHIEEVAKDFEAMFMTEMLKPMFAEIKVDEKFGGGKGEEIFRGFMLQEYGKLAAERGELGIADAVKKELIRMQGEEITPEDIYNAKKQVQADRAQAEVAQINPTPTNPTQANITLDDIIKEQTNAE
jgi:Rod binding domain-containing protein